MKEEMMRKTIRNLLTQEILNSKKLKLILISSLKKVTLMRYLTFFPGHQRTKMTRMRKLRKMNKKIRVQIPSIFLDLGADLKKIVMKRQKMNKSSRRVIFYKLTIIMLMRNKIWKKRILVPIMHKAIVLKSSKWR